jgi:hypothetical protein
MRLLIELQQREALGLCPANAKAFCSATYLIAGKRFLGLTEYGIFVP